MNEKLEKRTITIGRVGPYGVKVGEVWYGLNRPITPKDFTESKTYDVEMKESKGKYYIVSVLREVYSTVAKVQEAKEVVAALPTYKDETAERQERILRQGIVQAVASAVLTNRELTDEVLGQVESIAMRLISFVKNVQ